MAMGRPREWDREKLKWQIMHWAELPDSLNINAFCVLPDVMIPPSKLLDIVKADEDFREVYELMKAKLAVRREEANSDKLLGNWSYSISHSVYDVVTKAEKREALLFEKSLEKETQNPDALGVQQKFDAILDQLSARKRNIDDSNISKET